MFQHFEESTTIKGTDSLKSFIWRNFDEIERERKKKETPKKKNVKNEEKKETPKKKKDKDEEKKETKTTRKKNLVRFTSMLLQYMAAFIKKSPLDFSNFRPSSPLGQHLLYHLNHTNATEKMVSKIDEGEDDKGNMTLVR